MSGALDLVPRLLAAAQACEPSTPAALTRADADFPTAVPKPLPLTRVEETLVQGFRDYVAGLSTSATSFKLCPLDLATAQALARALEVTSADRDRLGDAMVYEKRRRRIAQRECDLALDRVARLEQALRDLGGSPK